MSLTSLSDTDFPAGPSRLGRSLAPPAEIWDWEEWPGSLTAVMLAARKEGSRELPLPSSKLSTGSLGRPFLLWSRLGCAMQGRAELWADEHTVCIHFAFYMARPSWSH